MAIRKEKTMFTVAIRALAESSQELQQMVRKLNQQTQEVESIVSSIRRLSAYSDVIRILRLRVEDLDMEKGRMAELMAALNQIQKMYQQSERNITDYGDQVRKINYYRNMDTVSLGNIRDSIREYQIR
ncbi:MAG: hypothetical protein HFG59_02980 [Lachnospiraceae bacterium]|nr:hypothetical protein [Lachnospiraceae bacterium]